MGGVKRPLGGDSEGEKRMGMNVLIELKLTNQEQMIETIPKIDQLDDQVEKIQLKILQRDHNDHDHRMFDIKFEYGFREQKKTTKLRGGKVVKKREKKECINIGGDGNGPREKKKRQKPNKYKDEELSEEEEPEVKKVITKVSMDDLLGQMMATKPAVPQKSF